MYKAYVDGACRGNQNETSTGGYGCYIINPDGTSYELYDGFVNTTNNVMELSAAIAALYKIPEGSTVTIISDSQYVVKGMNEWITNWEKKNYKGVKNSELWKELKEKSSKYNVTYEWVRGHDGDYGNERADALANKGCDLVG